MSSHKIITVFLSLALVFFTIGCTDTSAKNRDSTGSTPPVVGGVAVGLTPKVLYADRGDNISFNVELSSTENANDIVTININGSWFSKTLSQDIQAGGKALIPIHITVPSDAVNMSIKIETKSHNLNATSSTSGAIIIKNIGG